MEANKFRKALDQVWNFVGTPQEMGAEGEESLLIETLKYLLTDMIMLTVTGIKHSLSVHTERM